MSDLIIERRWAKIDPFNPLSVPQVKAYIAHRKWPMPLHRTERDENGERKPTTNDESLLELLREGKPAFGDKVLEGVLDARHLSKARSYLSEKYVHPDGRLHPIFTMKPKQRLSSASPNVMNFPKGKKGEILKEASAALLSSIEADPGYTLFSADWNSLHPALIAHFAGDANYARIARLGDHAFVMSHFLAMEGRLPAPVDLDRPDSVVKAELDALKERFPADYKVCKVANLAYKYLQGVFNMARTTGLTIDKTKKLRAAIDAASPKVAAWRRTVLDTAHFQGRLVSPFGLPLCVAPESRILTRDLRWVPAGSLKAGDELLAFDEEPRKGWGSRRFKPTKVVAAAPGRAPVARVTLTDGSTVVTTLDHPWLAKFSYKTGNWVWKKTSELRPGSRVMKPFECWASNTSYAAGWLAGMFDGEGCWNTSVTTGTAPRRANSLSVYQNPGPTLKRLRKTMTELGFAVGGEIRNRVTAKGLATRGGTLRILGGLANKLRFLGEIRPDRLIANLQRLDIGQLRERGGSTPVFVQSVAPLGPGDITVLETGSRTYFAEGFAMHNTFFDVYKRGPNGKVELDKEGEPKLGAEAPEASSFFPLATESGMLREVLVMLFEDPRCELRYKPFTALEDTQKQGSFVMLIPEHDKIIGQALDSEVEGLLRELIVPTMNRAWPELRGLRVGVDVEIGKRLQECPKPVKDLKTDEILKPGCPWLEAAVCEAGHMKGFRP